MDVCEEDFPEHYRPIIRQMKKATESIDIRYRMDMEVDILEEMEEIKQAFLKQKARVQELQEELNATKELIAQTKQAIKLAQDKLTSSQQNLKIIAQNLNSAGIPEEDIAQYLGSP
jgi:chromosome segregation ATPase